MSYPTVVDDPVTVSVTTVVRRLREAGVMTIRVRERRRPEMLVLVVFRAGGQQGGNSAVLVFDTDHWAGGPNVPGAYFDYLGDRWTPEEQLIKSVVAMLGTRAA